MVHLQQLLRLPLAFHVGLAKSFLRINLGIQGFGAPPSPLVKALAVVKLVVGHVGRLQPPLRRPRGILGI